MLEWRFGVPCEPAVQAGWRRLYPSPGQPHVGAWIVSTIVSVPTATPTVASSSRMSRSDAPFCRSSMMPSFTGISFAWRDSDGCVKCTRDLVETLRACCDVCGFAHRSDADQRRVRNSLTVLRGRASLLKTQGAYTFPRGRFRSELCAPTTVLVVHPRAHEVL